MRTVAAVEVIAAFLIAILVEDCNSEYSQLVYL